MSWLEVGALCFGAAPAVDLPALLTRLFHPQRLEYLRDSLWELTAPVEYRLRTDEEAVSALQHAMAGGSVETSTPLFAPATAPSEGVAAPERSSYSQEPPDHLDDEAARRIYVAAVSLKNAGMLDAQDRHAALSLLDLADARLVVADPFSGEAGPLGTLARALATANGRPAAAY